MNSLPYRPHPMLRNGHIQTVMVGLYCGERPQYCARPFIVQLSDGEALVVHEEQGASLGGNSHLAILIHGLGGDHSSNYLERLAPRLQRSGFKVWRVDLRGCGAGAEYAWRPANAGRSHDLAKVLLKAQKLYPGMPVHLVGFSLSGNIVLKLLGEAAAGQSELNLGRSTLASALAVAPPVQLEACARNMDRFSRQFYTRFYLKALDGQVQARKRQWPRWEKVPDEPKIRTIRQFDARYTAPLSGYSGTEEYYRLASAAPWLPSISTPTQILADRNDPIVPYKTIAQAQLSDSTELVTTRYGGHMGYFGLDENGKLIRWMEHYVVQRLRENRLRLSA